MIYICHHTTLAILLCIINFLLWYNRSLRRCLVLLLEEILFLSWVFPFVTISRLSPTPVISSVCRLKLPYIRGFFWGGSTHFCFFGCLVFVCLFVCLSLCQCPNSPQWFVFFLIVFNITPCLSIVLSTQSSILVSHLPSSFLDIYIYIYIYFFYTNPSARAGYDTKSIKLSLTGLYSEFSF